MKIRVRFAPSPTGELHIGGARTALFNWLFARHCGGRFVLRIEDTDVLRSREDVTRSIVDNLQWLGLHWDEGPEVGGEHGPYMQSQRISIYKKFAGELLDKGKAYRCYCTTEELKKRKQEMQKKKLPPVYDGRCRNLCDEEKRKLEQQGREPTIRFKVSGEGELKVKDLLREQVSFEVGTLGDFIILKSDGTPTFNFANVIDDALMQITHVIRGDDHLSNTPRQVLLYRALDFKPPVYAHIPMILGKDGAKLSKRHGATSVEEYRKQGYLPWAVVNYLALLGWSTPESQQFFTRDELIKKFSLERVNKSPAVFDVQKLTWMNAEYIRRTKTEELTQLLIPYLREKGWVGEKIVPSVRDKITRIVELEKDRLKKLSDIRELANFFFEEEFSYHQKAVEKRLKKDYVVPLLERVKAEIEAQEVLTKENLEGIMRGLAEELELSTSKVFHPLRVALTGKMRGPGLFELAEVMGKEEVVHRIGRTLNLLREEKFFTA